MAQDVLGIDGYRRRISTEIDQCTARALLCFCQHAVGQSQRGQVHLSDIDIGRLEALVQVLIECLAFQNIEEVAFQTCRLDAYGVDLELRAHLVFLYGSVENLLIWVGHVTVGVHQFDDHILCDNALVGEILANDVPDAADGLSANADIHLSDFSLELCFQLLDDAGEALCGLVDVIDHTLTDKSGRLLLYYGEYLDTAVEILLARDTSYFR